MGLYRARGVVVRTYRLGEADRIVHLVTDARGKVRAVAKGVRRTKSRFGARLEPGSHVSLLCWEGRDLDVVNQAEVLDSFRGLREDLERMRAAAVMLEAADLLSQERHEDPDAYRMLVGALRTLEAGGSALVAPAFLWKLLAADGVAPALETCASCGSTGPLVAFDPVDAGVRCRACRRGIPVSAEALALLRAFGSGGLGAALAGEAQPAWGEVERLATQAMEAHLERRLRSVHVLDG